MLNLHSAIAGVALVSAIAAAGQPTPRSNAQDALNWDVLLSLYPPRAIAAREEGAVGFIGTLVLLAPFH